MMRVQRVTGWLVLLVLGTGPAGAETEPEKHWAFRPHTPPRIPASVHPVDYLIDRTLRTRDFTPTPAADLRTLIRRATYDLHGLPPTPEQLATARENFPRLISALLASPRYGERWGRHWLDVARYSDAKDGVLMYGDARIRPFAYTYRDYVIRAFNEDKPFDEFIREQIAADQMNLPANSPRLAAMGLLTLGRLFDRNPHDVIDDQIDVITRGFLGLTVSCARCHDHKFDPVPTEDYYSLYGVFASSVRPYERPRIEAVSPAGQVYEKELAEKLRQVQATRRLHYEETLQTARDRTPDYLVKVATTEPDVSETAIFFLSLIPEQLRPQITYRWRQLIARRAHPRDPIFGPWYDMMREPKLYADRWRERGVDQRIIDGLVAAQPATPEEIARTYGQVIRRVWRRERDIEESIAKLVAELATLQGGSINLADIVAGGNGFGTGTRGHGVHPATGAPTSGGEGFVAINRHDELIAVPESEFIDGVFVPKSGTATISSTGLRVSDLPPTGGQTWDYFKYGPSGGFTVNTIDGVDYSKAPHSMLSVHANKGITFDLHAFRSRHEFRNARFQALLGHGGAKDMSRLDCAVYLDGKRVAKVAGFKAQQKGHSFDIELPETARFLTLVVTEGAQGISHDQAILGNPRIVPAARQKVSERRRRRIARLQQRVRDLQSELKNLPALQGDPIADLLLSRGSPVWFPENEIYYYLSRQKKDAYRGLVGQLDAISVKHKAAAARAMVLVDAMQLVDPVVFQRGDPTQPGTRVPRRFLKIAIGTSRKPFGSGSGRLELADAIVASPLTARVWVNRVWMHHFGEPLVENPSDFGLRTRRPIYLELLDYLAATLVRNGWRTKPLHQLIMTSRAYQRASRIPATEEMARQRELDPRNELIWRANRRRLDLEQMRDTMLVVSGKMDFTMYGRPTTITDLKNNRRTVYAFVERQNLPNVVQTFDFANADTSAARRVTTTVPQQALYAMNSRFIAQTAKALAARCSGGADGKRIARAYSRVLGRAPTVEELEMGLRFVDSSPEAWEQYVHVLLMTNELMFLD